MAFTCAAAAGAKLTFEFRAWPDASQPGAIDSSHLGSAAIYLKPVSNVTTDPAAGPGWFKIYDEGYDTQAKKWATEKLIDSHGLLSINLPTGLPTGYYLARTEILTLQNVTRGGYVDPQFYVNCAQLFITQTQAGDAVSPLAVPADRAVPIPGHVPDARHPGLTFNIYEADPLATPYQVVGPAVFFPGSSTTTAAAPKTNTKTLNQSETSETQQQTDGVIPRDCALKNANWCATPLPPYTDEASCWASSADCFAQLERCYASAPPTGSRGCRVWEERLCAVVQRGCADGLWRGPPPRIIEELAEIVNNAGEGGVDAPVPGGGKIPAAVNQNARADDVGENNGAGDKAETATATATATQAPAPVATSSGCGRNGRQKRRRLARF